MAPPVSCWDELRAIGLRFHYVASVLAAPSMAEQRSGLVVNIFSWVVNIDAPLTGLADGVAKARLGGYGRHGRHRRLDLAGSLQQERVSAKPRGIPPELIGLIMENS